MPEQYYKPRSRHAPQLTFKKAAGHGMLVKLRCTLCNRTTYYLAADLLEIYGDRPLFDFRLECSRDKTAEFVHADYHRPEPGDYGSLNVRRPGPIIHTQTWKTVKLGDERPR